MVDPAGQRQLDRGIECGRRLERLQAHGSRRFDARREPGEDAAKVGAALPAGSLAVEAVTLEEDALPLLVDETHEPIGHGLGVRPGSVAARGDEPLAEVYDHPAPGRVALAADALVVAARLALGEEGVPDGDLVRIRQSPAQARIDDAEQRAQVVLARLLDHACHDARELLRNLAQGREQERLLAAEVEVDGSGRMPGGARDFRGGQLRQAVLRDRRDRRLDQVELGPARPNVGAGFKIRSHGNLLDVCRTFYPAWPHRSTNVQFTESRFSCV